jgi:hypothetical protein
MRLLMNLGAMVMLGLGGGIACDGMAVDEAADDPAVASGVASEEAALAITPEFVLTSQTGTILSCAPRGSSCARNACCAGSFCQHLPGPAGSAKGSVCVDSHAWRAAWQAQR